MNFNNSSPQNQLVVAVWNGSISLQDQGIDKLPDEVLMTVFEDSVPPDSEDAVSCELEGTAGRYDTVTTALLLTRVSKRWRSVALHTRRIWGSVRIPARILQSGANSTQLQQLIAALNRSGHTPLSVFLPWDIPDYQWREDDALAVAQDIFIELCRHANRWRRLRYQAPASGTHSSILTLLFGRSTPALECFHVSSQHRSVSSQGLCINTSTLPGLLPNCPRLKTAYIGVDGFHHLEATATALVHLTVDSPAMHGKLWELLLCVPHIQTLRLSVVGEKMVGDIQLAARDQMLDRPIVLASLKRLEVLSPLLSETLALATEYTRMPKLSELRLPHSITWHEDFVNDVVLFIEHAGSALTDIIIWEDMERHVYMATHAIDVGPFWTSLSSAPFLAPCLRNLSMFEIVDIPGWDAFRTFRALRCNPQNAGTAVELDTRFAPAPVVALKPVAHKHAPTGMLAGRGRWP